MPRDGETLGEIVARGNVVMAGYYNDPQATAAAIRDGWFHSGDAAVVHPDGYVEIRDRIKDVIISGGENISSVEVEAALLAHPAVMEVGVVGLPHEKWGEAPHAFVVLEARRVGDTGGAARRTAARARALQGAARIHVRRRSCRGRRRGRFRSTCCGRIGRTWPRSSATQVRRLAPAGLRAASCRANRRNYWF